MDLSRIKAGEQVPKDVNVIIEIPAFSNPVKYEIDKDSGALMVDRFMTSSMHYPANYGFVPNTLSEDGDPVDVLVITPHSLVPGCVINTRPVALLKMTDEKGPDAKVISVPNDDLSPLYHNMNNLHDLSQAFRDQVNHFFEHYKDLENSKWVKIEGWFDVDVAYQEILSSIERFDNA